MAHVKYTPVHIPIHGDRPMAWVTDGVEENEGVREDVAVTVTDIVGDRVAVRDVEAVVELVGLDETVPDTVTLPVLVKVTVGVPVGDAPWERVEVGDAVKEGVKDGEFVRVIEFDGEFDGV